MMNIIDVKAVSGIAQQHGLLLGVDNTFASPYLQNPLDLGADIVMHSVTKYLGGHSDVIMGALVVKNGKLAEDLAFVQNSSGAVPGPQDCFLVLRGIKTLHLRMQRHCENGAVIARYLRKHSKVEKVYWPGFEDHPNHKVAKEQMRDFGGMISFLIKNGTSERTMEVCERFKIFSLAESLGGVESLANLPALMTHASVPQDERKRIGIHDNLIRLSVGIEDSEDLLEDLNQALS
jgi:cystathionine beta-lyase